MDDRSIDRVTKRKRHYYAMAQMAASVRFRQLQTIIIEKETTTTRGEEMSGRKKRQLNEGGRKEGKKEEGRNNGIS